MPTINELLQQKKEMERRMRARKAGLDLSDEAPDDGGLVELDLDELEKDDLVDIAVKLKLDSPSNLKRWGEEKLRKEIRNTADSQAEVGGQE